MMYYTYLLYRRDFSFLSKRLADLIFYPSAESAPYPIYLKTFLMSEIRARAALFLLLSL
jgi:hypothetical protein